MSTRALMLLVGLAITGCLCSAEKDSVTDVPDRPDATFVQEGQHRELVLLHSEACAGSRDMLTTLREIAADFDITWRVVTELDIALPLPTRTPMLALLEDGRLIDLHRGGNLFDNPGGKAENRRTVLHLLARNGLIDLDPGPLLRPAGSLERNLVPILRRPSLHPAINLDAVDWQHQDLSELDFAGSSLRGADLRHADLTGALLPHADLRGARLEGANVNRVFWSRTRCPNGRLSDETGGVCRLHE